MLGNTFKFGSLYVNGTNVTSFPHILYAGELISIKTTSHEIEWVKIHESPSKDKIYYTTAKPFFVNDYLHEIGKYALSYNQINGRRMLNPMTYNLEGKEIKICHMFDDSVIGTNKHELAKKIYNVYPSNSYVYEQNHTGLSKHYYSKYNVSGNYSSDLFEADICPAYTMFRYVLVVLNPNSAPTISGADANLGDKNAEFNIEYSVNDADTTNTLTVVEKLNSTVLRTINNATRNEPYTISITDEQIKALELNSNNRVQIEVSDGAGGIAYRNYTFTKSNSAPVITGQDEDLGGLVNHFSKTYQVHDQEGDVITVTEKLNGTVLREFEATQNTDYTVTIDEAMWQTLGNETHNLTIEATDSIGSTTVRTFTFRRLVNSILLELKEPSITDAKASKVMVVPVWRGINNADVVVSACNNALDVAPTWEDITDAVLNNIPYMFTNEAKTSEKWGVNIKFEITRKEGTTEQIILDGFGGAFE